MRRRIAAAALATFVAAWLAVAALGKGGSTSTAATSASPTTGTPGQSDDGAGPAERRRSQTTGPGRAASDAGGDEFGSPSDGSSSGADSGSSQSSGQQGGPVTTGQS